MAAWSRLRTYQFYSPLATTVKAVYAQEGDLVHSGKLILTLDDVAARAQVASAESAVRTAQASLDAATHNGTQAEQQTSAAEVEQDRLARDQAQHDLDALTKLAATGAAAPGEVAAARERLESAQASLHAAEQSAQHRYSPAGDCSCPGCTERRRGRTCGGAARRGADCDSTRR